MATHSKILAWEIPWTEEAVRLQSVESQESGKIERPNNNNMTKLHDVDSIFFFFFLAFTFWSLYHLLDLCILFNLSSGYFFF